MSNKIEIPKTFKPLFDDYRYKVLYGGRGSGKSWAAADCLLIKGVEKKTRVLCAREFQTSIKDSVHKLLADRIKELKLDFFYTVTDKTIKGRNGTEFIFKGLRRNITEVKSTEGIDICWIEEGQAVSEESWQTLIPTIRKPSSEIWVVFNPDSPDDATYKKFVTNTPPDTLLIKANYSDNPFFPDVLEKERQFDFENRQDIYYWKWEGEPRIFTDAQIFKGKFEVREDIPESDIYYYGADWGFSKDPNTLVKCFIHDNNLFIVDEAYKHHVELHDIPKLWDQVLNGSRKEKIRADNSRPETISFLKKNYGFDVVGDPKLKIEEGIEFIKSFKKVYISTKCPKTLEEFKLYAYKIDPNSGQPTSTIIDDNNHIVDALRYALYPVIKNKQNMKPPSIGASFFGI